MYKSFSLSLSLSLKHSFTFPAMSKAMVTNQSSDRPISSLLGRCWNLGIALRLGRCRAAKFLFPNRFAISYISVLPNGWCVISSLERGHKQLDFDFLLLCLTIYKGKNPRIKLSLEPMALWLYYADLTDWANELVWWKMILHDFCNVITRPLTITSLLLT